MSNLLAKLLSPWRYRAHNSRIGPSCEVGAGAVIVSSCLRGHNRVDRGARLNQTIVDEWSAIQADAILSASEIGSNTYIGRRAMVASTRIGRFCSIGPNVVCGYGTHPIKWPSSSPLFYSTLSQTGRSFASDESSRFNESDQVHVGNDVWIGANAVVRNGVTIGHGAVIGAMAMVTKDVPPYAVIGGVPARILKMRFSDRNIARLLQVEWWAFPDHILRENYKRWQADDIEEFLIWAEGLDR